MKVKTKSYKKLPNGNIINVREEEYEVKGKDSQVEGLKKSPTKRNTKKV